MKFLSCMYMNIYLLNIFYSNNMKTWGYFSAPRYYSCPQGMAKKTQHNCCYNSNMSHVLVKTIQRHVMCQVLVQRRHAIFVGYYLNITADIKMFSNVMSMDTKMCHPVLFVDSPLNSYYLIIIFSKIIQLSGKHDSSLFQKLFFVFSRLKYKHCTLISFCKSLSNVTLNKNLYYNTNLFKKVKYLMLQYD